MADVMKVVEGQQVTFTPSSPRAIAWMQQAFQTDELVCDVSDPHGQAMTVSFETTAQTTFTPPLTFDKLDE